MDIPPIYIYFLTTAKKSGEELSDGNIYACLKRFLKAEAGAGFQQELSTLPVIKREQGQKPRFDKDIGVYFSVSHSDGMWLCAASRQQVGLDVQAVTQSFNKGIAKRFFHPDEHKFLEENDFKGFFGVWTAKESYVKYTGRGIDNDFSDFSVVKNGGLCTAVCGAEIRELPFFQGFSLCVCAERIDKTELVPL